VQHYCTLLFFKLFFETEPFAAVLIAHGTLGVYPGICLEEALVRPKGPKFKAGGRDRGWAKVPGE